MYGELGYLNLIRQIMKSGRKQSGRNGTTYTSIGETLRFSLEDNKIPLMTTKKLAWRVCLKELLWFMNGDTDNRLLKDHNVNIWTGNGTRAFLNSRGLDYLREDDLGPVYGHQWRSWNAKYDKKYGCDYDYKNDGGGIDQLQNIIDEINKSKESGESSRRMIMSAWNPEQLDEMALPPCHVLSQYHLVDNKLSCTLYQRSGDVGLGVPFNIASYSFLTHLLARHCDLEAGEFVHFIGNAHIYDDHIEPLKNQLENDPYEFPDLEIKEKRENIDDYKFEDFEINNYKFHKVIKMDMRV
jgi:thymidylate synthase